MSLYDFEHEKHAEGYKYICGVDEAGRGPLAGPVFAAAVILPEDYEIEGINDSKKLSEKKREKLFDEIIEHALAYSVQSCDNFAIDEMNILAATMQTMKTAVECLSITPNIVYVDGNRLPELSVPAEYVIHGDAASASIAAASILANPLSGLVNTRSLMLINSRVSRQSVCVPFILRLSLYFSGWYTSHITGLL